MIATYDKYTEELKNLRYAQIVHGRYETWEEIAKRVCDNVLSVRTISQSIKDDIYDIIVTKKFIPGGRILSQAGKEYHQTNNCFLLEAENTREGWGELSDKMCRMFMSGGGVGCDYSKISPYGTMLKRSGGIASGPIPLIELSNAIAKAARQGGGRRGANYASLVWNHEDINEFIELKKNITLEHTNISVRFDNNWLNSYSHIENNLNVDDVFLKTLHYACKYGDPGFQFDKDNQILRNACTEIISFDDCDVCCIGSINLANITNLSEFIDVTNLSVLFLLCNTLYSDIPYPKVSIVQEKNRRIGLGLMGVGEWFIQRNLPYGEIINNSNDGFDKWLNVYKNATKHCGAIYSHYLDINEPIATRAIAPTGTISILGQTTSGIEPLFHTAYERCYNTLKEKHNDNGYVKTKIIEPVAQKWIEQGYNIRDIDTAYTLSQSIEGIERRIKFQAYMQSFVDNGISSTINLPKYEEGIEYKIAPILKKYLPYLRGITFYPDGRYENQPVRPIDINDVEEFLTDQYESCNGGVCGI